MLRHRVPHQSEVSGIMSLLADFVLKDARQLLTMAGGDPKDAPEARLGILENGWLAAYHGQVVAVGTRNEVLSAIDLEPGATVLNGRDYVVSPGLVDCHTHVVFVGSREEEYELRLSGVPYLEIARRGGGILASVRAVREADISGLVRESRPRLDRMLLSGTTTCEAKSGYGLTIDDEMKTLEAIRVLSRSHPIDLVPTFLGAHETPEEYREAREEYLRLVIEEMIPEVSRRRLAEFVDVFCEKGVFSAEESRAVLTAGKEHGLKPKIHCDEFFEIGGAKVAAEVGAVSADHLSVTSPDGVRALSGAGVVPVLLPGVSFSLGKDETPPVQEMVDAGLGIALATDCNPGTSMTESLPIVVSIACSRLRFTSAAAWLAITRNAARALDREGKVGSLEPGAKADLVFWDMPTYRSLPYHFGSTLADTVVKEGRVVVQRHRLAV